MRPNALREATRRALAQQAHKQQTRLSPGEKRHCKRMATAISVYEIGGPTRAPRSRSWTLSKGLKRAGRDP
jgi:hypothetical protein